MKFQGKLRTGLRKGGQRIWTLVSWVGSVTPVSTGLWVKLTREAGRVAAAVTQLWLVAALEVCVPGLLMRVL